MNERTATPAAGEAVPAADDGPTNVDMELDLYDTSSAANLVSHIEDHILDTPNDVSLRFYGIDPKLIKGGYHVFVLTEDEVDAVRFALRTLYAAARAQIQIWEAWRADVRQERRPAA